MGVETDLIVLDSEPSLDRYRRAEEPSKQQVVAATLGPDPGATGKSEPQTGA